MIERPEKLNNQAIILASGGSYTEAIACFKRAITIDKSNYLLWFNLGVTYRDAGDLFEAKKALSIAFDIAPQNNDVVETYATICLSLQQLEQVIDICEEGLNFNPVNSHLWNLMGVVEFQRENYDMASEYFESAVTINPYYADALFNLKDTYFMLNNKNGVKECAKRLKEIE